MKSYEEIARNAIKRAANEKAARRRRKSAMLGAALCVVLAAVGILIARGLLAPHDPRVLPSSASSYASNSREPDSCSFISNSEANTNTEAAAYENSGTVKTQVPITEEPARTVPASEIDSELSVPESEAISEPGKEEIVSGEYGDASSTVAVSATVKPSGDVGGSGEIGNIRVTIEWEGGEYLSNEDGAAYLQQNLSSIRSALSASGVQADALTVRGNGYAVLNVGDPCEVMLNVKEYLLYNGDALTAIVTLIKENGEVHGTPSFGAAWFSDLGSFMEAHRGEALLNLNVGGQRCVLTPSGETYVFAQPETWLSPSEELSYEALCCSEIIYVP